MSEIDATSNASIASDASTAATTTAAVATAASRAAAPAVPEARDALLERYLAVRAYWGNIAFSPDGSQVAYITNTSGQLNVWRQSVLGGWPFQVTTFEDSTARGLLWTPSGELLAMADHGGDEQYQIIGIPARGGAVRRYTDRRDAQYRLGDASLAPDGHTVAIAGNDREPTEADILLLDQATGALRRVLAGGGVYAPGYWSPDGRWLTVVDEVSNVNQRVLLVDVATGEAREVLPHKEECLLRPGPWLPDGSGFYLATNRGREFQGIARYLLVGERVEWVLAPEWDVERLVLSRDGRRMVWAQNEDGYSRLYLRDEGQPPMRVTGLPEGSIAYFTLSLDAGVLALRMETATQPPEISVLELGPVGAPNAPQLRRLTFGILGGIMPDALVAPELVRYPTFDGRTVPAWLYRPPSARDDAPVPLVLAIHGGPESQERPEYNGFYQFLLASGIGVLAPNHRGSTGYGITYQKLVRRDFGGGDFRDLEATVAFARTLPWVDAARLGIYGASYGGFMTLSALTRLPDAWAAAVDFFGPSDLISTMRTVPPTWRKSLAAWCGDPDADAEMLRAHSPITYVEQARAPLLVVQGAHDPRVVRAESDRMVERLRQLGREVEYHVYDDEGHGFTKRANLLSAYRYAAAFLARHLLDRDDSAERTAGGVPVAAATAAAALTPGPSPAGEG